MAPWTERAIHLSAIAWLKVLENSVDHKWIFLNPSFLLPYVEASLYDDSKLWENDIPMNKFKKGKR